MAETPAASAASAGRPEPGTPLARIYDRSLDCVHCGLCLPACPTYRETGRETSSPRGRIHLMRAVAEGRVAPGELLAEEAFLCLDCRACETACPSGVRFGRMVEETRAVVEQGRLRRGIAPHLERALLRGVVAHPGRLGAAVSALGWVQRLRLDRLARPLLPGALRERLDLAPRVPSRAARALLPERIPADGERRGRVMLFTGCVQAELFGAVNAATARVLARNGFEVLVPRDQGCCGALHAHAGDPDFARALAHRNAGALARLGSVDALVVNSAGCGAALREASEWLPGEADALARATRDVLELLDEVGLRAPTHPIAARVCYDDPCHLIHGQGVADAPRRILAAIPGLELVPHEDASSCCGAAGTYSITHPEMSRAILARKLRALAAAGPALVATGNPGCLLQIEAGARRAGLPFRVVHPVELLDRAYGGPSA